MKLRTISSLSFTALLLGVIGWAALRAPQLIRGDGLEYILQTQALAFDGSLVIHTDRRADYWNRTNPYGRVLGAVSLPRAALDQRAQAGGGFGGLYTDRFGAWRFYHFWGYSLAAAPLYRLLHELGPAGSEYQAFLWLNCVFLGAPLLLAAMRRPGIWTVLLCGLMLCTPLSSYLTWTHPELMLFFLVFLSFFLAGGRGAAAAPWLLGLAAAQNIPLVFFFPALFSLVPPARRRLLDFGAGLALAFSPLLYFRYFFGVWNLIAALGLADLALADMGRTAALFFGPMIGAFWYFPACFVFMPAYLRRANRRTVLLTWLGMLAGAWLCTGTSNLYSSQVGPVRYMVWLLAPAVFLLLDQDWGALFARRRLRAILFALGLLFCLAAVRFWRSHQFLYEHPAHDFMWRTQQNTARLYRQLGLSDDLEVLVENIRRRELGAPQAFDGIYIWNLDAQSSLWVIAKRALRKYRRFDWCAGGLPAYRAVPENRVFVLRHGCVGIAPAGELTFQQHPFLGGYLLVWTKRAAAPAQIRSDAPVFVR